MGEEKAVRPRLEVGADFSAEDLTRGAWLTLRHYLFWLKAAELDALSEWWMKGKEEAKRGR